MLVIDNITNWDADSQVENIGRDFIIVGQTSLAKQDIMEQLVKS